MDFDPGILQGMAVALGVGLLVGVERERRRDEDADDKLATARKAHAKEERPKDSFVYPLISVRSAGSVPSRN